MNYLNSNSIKMSLEISRDESDRISVFKLWLSIMIVFIHSYDSNVNFAEETISFDVPFWIDTLMYIIQVLSMSAVPAFFFLSSYLLYRKPFTWKHNIQKKARSLLIPYFIFNSFWVAVYFVAQHIPALSSFFSQPGNIVANWSVGEWFSHFFGSPSSIYPVLYPLWFIRDLFILNLVSPVFAWIEERIHSFSLVLYISIWILLDSSHIFFLDLKGICFWGIACYFAKNRISISKMDRYKTMLVFIYPLMVIAVCFLRGITGIGNQILLRCCLLFGVAFWYVCTTRITITNVKKRILFVSKYSFCIFLFHEMSLRILRKISIKLIPQSSFSVMTLYFVIPIIIVLYCIMLSWLLDKYTPKLYKIINGGRSR